MFKNRRILKVPSYAACLLLLIFLVGCTEALKQGEFPVQRADYGQLSLFMSGQEKASVDITFNLLAVNAMAEDGTYREITGAPHNISSIAMSGRQILLSERALPEGTYKKLQLIIKQASLKKKGKAAADLALPPEGIQLDIKFTVSRDRNTSLFLTWYADASIADGYLFKPALTVSGQVPQLSSLLVYVTNEGSNNVFVINRQSGEVVATIMVGKRPRGIAVGTRRDSLKVYVANSGSNSISVIDPATNKVDTEIPVRFGWGAEGIAVAKLSSERELIFVTNYSSNTVSIIDGSTYQEMEKINVGNGPIAVATDSPLDDILNARSFLSFEDINILKNYRERFINVYVVNKNSKDISIVRIDVSTGRSVDVVNVGVEWTPVALGMDFQRGKVYVANYDSDKLSVIDIVKFVKGSKADIISAINNVGNATIGVIADPSFNRVYLLKELTDEIIVIKPFSEGSENLRAAITPTIDIIAVGNAPRALALDPEARKLYVVNRGAGNISVVDKTTGKVEKVIPAGKRPYGIAILNR